MGINGTPVIDLAAKTLYVIAYVNGSPSIYQLHALNLSHLTDKTGSPVKVAATHKLTDGSTITFDATVQRQRPALLELDGTIYAGFGSFCDFAHGQSRGWLLGWKANTLAPLGANKLDDTRKTSPNNYFLSSIWMSGYGIAGSSRRVYFSTGNSDPSGTTYDGVTNIQESVVRLQEDLITQLGIFTPSNVGTLDRHDTDLGSGGVLLLPKQSGSVPLLAVMAGKDGRLFLLNRLSLGKALDTHPLGPSGGCWCGPSFFTGPDKINRIVTSQGRSLATWHVDLSPSPHLTPVRTASVATGQDPGFFTSVSSNGTTAGTAIIWAVGRPTRTTAVNLYAFVALSSGGTYKLLFSSPAGSWPNTGGNANIVPVVANGKVYVAANKTLTIFGISSKLTPRIPSPPTPPVASLPSPHEISGTLLAVDGSTLPLQTRAGKSVKIDDSQAVQNKQVGALSVGDPFTAQGSSFDKSGMVLQATSIVRAKGSSGELWPPNK